MRNIQRTVTGVLAIVVILLAATYVLPMLG
jgi:hypothetical protein